MLYYLSQENFKKIGYGKLWIIEIYFGFFIDFNLLYRKF